MDADEIARLRAVSADCNCSELVKHLTAALEQARKERDSWKQIASDNANAAALWSTRADQHVGERDAAQKDAKDARALLGEAKEIIDSPPGYATAALRARIEAMLEQKPMTAHPAPEAPSERSGDGTDGGTTKGDR
jgi:hypothetical protein